MGIGLGAFGAHGLEAILVENGRTDNWETATQYHLIHAIALFVLAVAAEKLRSRWAFRFWIIGILVFCGSLYTLALTNITILGAITPLGGVAFIAGWLSLIFENKK